MNTEPGRIFLPETEYKKLLQDASSELPNEACGLIAGEKAGENIYIRKVYHLKNIDQSSEHFRMDPKEQLKAVTDMRDNGLIPLGNWHSHPATPSRPSQEDIRYAYDRNALYMILSLKDDFPVLNAFHIEDGAVRKEILELTEGELDDEQSGEL